MVRRTKEAAAATREQLLDAAESVFRERGVTRTSLDTIAIEAGLTRGAVYWHFRDKVDLFNAMCARATSPMQTLLQEAEHARGSDALATLRQLCVNALTYLARDARAQAFFEIVFHKSELVGEMEPLAERHEGECSGARNRMTALLRRAIAQRQLPADTDVVIAAHALHACVLGVMHEWVMAKPYDLAAAATAIVDMAIAGLRAQPPRKRSPRRRQAKK
jgi:TetR/AcrR family acrAB operon transcriptional repressor